MFGYNSQFKGRFSSNASRRGIVMIDMLVGLVILAAFLIFGTMVILQIEETKLDSLKRNDEMAWATMQQSAAIHGLQANTNSGLFNESTYNVSPAAGAPIRVNSSSSEESVLTVGNLVITPRILTVADVPGRKGNVSVGYVLQDCYTAGEGDEIMPREPFPKPDLSVTLLRADDSTEIATFTPGSSPVQVVDISSNQVSWSDDGHMVLHYRVDGNDASLEQDEAHVDSLSQGVPWSYAVDEEALGDATGSTVSIPFAASDSSGNTISWTIQYTKLDVTLEQTRSLVDTGNVTLTDVSPALGGNFTSAVGVNQLVTRVSVVRGNDLPANFVRAIGLIDTVNGDFLTQDDSVSVVGQANYNPVASYFTGYTGNVWRSSVVGSSAYVNTPDPKTSNLTAVPSSIALTFDPVSGNYADGVTVTINHSYADAYLASQLVDGVADSEYYALRYEVFEDSIEAAAEEVTAASTEYAAPFDIQLDPGAEGYVEAKTFNSSSELEYFLAFAEASINYYSEFGPIDFQWGNIDADYNDVDDRTEYTYDGTKADANFHPSVQTGGDWAIAENWYTVPDNWRDVVQQGENYLFAKHPVDGPITVHLLWYYSETGWSPKKNDPHYLGGLIFNNDVDTYTVMGPDENAWIPMYFNSGDGSRSLISVLNSPKHGEFEEEYDPHVLQVKVNFENDLEINVSNTSSFKLEADQLDDDTGQYALYKTGPGKLYARVGNTGSNRPIYVEEGELICAIEDAFPSVPIYLDGGTLNLNRWEETFQSDLRVLSDSTIDMGDGSDLYSGDDDEFTFVFSNIIFDSVNLTIKNWSPGPNYQVTGGNSRLEVDSRSALPSWGELSNIDFEDWELTDTGYTSGGWVVPDGDGWNNWSIVPLAAPVQPNSRGYLYIEEDTHLYLDSNPDDGIPESVRWEYEDLVIKNGATLYLHYFTNDGSNPDVINFAHPVDASTLSKIKIYTDAEEAKKKPKSDGVNQSLDSNGNIQAYWYY